MFCKQRGSPPPLSFVLCEYLHWISPLSPFIRPRAPSDLVWTHCDYKFTEEALLLGIFSPWHSDAQMSNKMIHLLTLTCGNKQINKCHIIDQPNQVMNCLSVSAESQQMVLMAVLGWQTLLPLMSCIYAARLQAAPGYRLTDRWHLDKSSSTCPTIMPHLRHAGRKWDRLSSSWRESVQCELSHCHTVTGDRATQPCKLIPAVESIEHQE